MDMLNRIKTTVSNFSNVVLGNPVTREYEILEHIASAGPSLLWKVFRGFKKTTKEEAAVFVLEKKLIEKYPKNERDAIIAILKKGIANLTRLRHPSILTVQHSLEESRESLAFATEPVFASLANILGYQENLPVPPPKSLKEFDLFDIEIKYGFLQVTEGLAFLHTDVKMMHGNICPDSILVNRNGAWKLAGFDFCVQFASNSSQGNSFSLDEINIDLPPPCHPHLDYTAPERILGSSANPSSDMFSLGLLFYAVHNHGKSLLLNSGCSMHAIKQNFNNMKSISADLLSCLPAESRDHVKLLLSLTPELRPDAFQTSKLQMFEDIGVKTLQYLDSLYQWDNLQKSQFYRGLPQILAKMPKIKEENTYILLHFFFLCSALPQNLLYELHEAFSVLSASMTSIVQRVSLHRVIPCLAKEYHTPEMVPFVLPNILIIAEDATKEEFQSLILRDMIPLFQLQEPIQITLIFMQKMELLLSKCPPVVITNHIMPMMYRALESDAQQIQELCLSIIPKFASLIEYAAMKNALLPRIKKLCICTSYLSVRVNCLVCIGKLLEHLDKWLVLDEILPFLPQIPSKEPAVLMGVLGILKLTMSHKKLGMTKEIMATKIIPFLMPLSIENGLTLNQFNAVMTVVKEMVNYVEEEHKKKLEQLNSIRQEHSSTLEMTQIVNSAPGLVHDFPPETNKSGTDDIFKNLGLSLSGSSSKTVLTPSQNPIPPLGSPYAADKDYAKPLTLTLEEKKSLAWNQEQQRKWNNTAQKSISPSVDATSAFINSNLQKLSSSRALDAMSISSMPCSSPNTFAGNFVPAAQPLSLTGSYSSFVSSPQAFKPAHEPLSLDLKSFDSLLPNIGAKASVPMSKMESKPMAPMSIPKIAPPFSTPSAKSELDDLLG